MTLDIGMHLLDFALMPMPVIVAAGWLSSLFRISTDIF